MGVPKGAGDGQQQAGRLAVIQLPANDGLQARPGNIFHHQVGHAILLAIIQHSHNIGVRKLRQCLGFAFKTHLKICCPHLIRTDDLNRNISFQARIIRLVNGRHTTFTQLLPDVITPQVLPDHVRHGSPRSSAHIHITKKHRKRCNLFVCNFDKLAYRYLT